MIINWEFRVSVKSEDSLYSASKIPDADALRE